MSDRPSLLGAAADDWHIKAIVVAGGNESKLELYGQLLPVKVLLFFERRVCVVYL